MGIRPCRMHGLLPPRPSQTSRSPPPSFHFNVRSASVASRVRDGSRAATHKGRALSANTQTSMSFIEQFEQELVAKLNGKEDTASIVRWVSEKVLESYKNGITAGQKGATVKRQSKSSQSVPPQVQ